MQTEPSEQSMLRLGVYLDTYLKPVEKHIYRQLVGLKQVETHVFYRQTQHQSAFPFERLHQLRPNSPNWFKRAKQKYMDGLPSFVYRGYGKSLLNAIQEQGIEVLHIYFGYYAIELLPLFDALSIPIVVSFHGADATSFFNMPGLQYAQRIGQVFQKAALIFVRSEAMGQQLVAKGCPPEKIRVTRAAVDLEAFPLKAHTFTAGETVRFLQVCRLIPKKGLFTLLEAFEMVHQAYPHTTLTIVGDGPLKEPLADAIRQRGLEHAVTLTGYLEGPEVLAQMTTSHVFVHPSETSHSGDSEGIPNALIEAMAVGLPVISTYHAGIPELVRHGQCGFLVSEKRPEELAKAMMTMVKSPNRWQEWGQAGRLEVAQHHDSGQQMERLRQYYHEAKASSRLAKAGI